MQVLLRTQSAICMPGECRPAAVVSRRRNPEWSSADREAGDDLPMGYPESGSREPASATTLTSTETGAGRNCEKRRRLPIKATQNPFWAFRADKSPPGHLECLEKARRSTGHAARRMNVNLSRSRRTRASESQGLPHPLLLKPLPPHIPRIYTFSNASVSFAHLISPSRIHLSSLLHQALIPWPT